MGVARIRARASRLFSCKRLCSFEFVKYSEWAVLSRPETTDS